jgi:hypothetical protein
MRVNTGAMDAFLAGLPDLGSLSINNFVDSATVGVCQAMQVASFKM